MKYIAAMMAAAALAGTASAAAPKKASKQAEVKSQPVVVKQNKKFTVYLHPSVEVFKRTRVSREDNTRTSQDNMLMESPAYISARYDITSNYSVEAGLGQQQLTYLVAQAGMPTKSGLKPYVQAGAAHSKINRYNPAQKARLNGLVGAGVEYSLNESVVVRLDGKVFTQGLSLKQTTPTISIGIGYRF